MLAVLIRAMEKVKIIEITLSEDDRGWVAWPIEEEELENHQLSHFHVPSLKPGVVRGNHYHLRTVEYTLILSGPCRAVFEDNETGEQEEVLVEGDRPVLFRTASNVTHAFKNESNNDLYLLCYEKREGDRKEQDIYRKVILP
jgi:dTDP-4-dehydrorhamnose 3,5-epimerase-like enzyme